MDVKNINSARTLFHAKQMEEEELSSFKNEKCKEEEKERERVEREKTSLGIATKTMHYNHNSMFISIFALIVAFLALVVSILK